MLTLVHVRVRGARQPRRHVSVDLHLRQTRSPDHSLSKCWSHIKHLRVLGSCSVTWTCVESDSLQTVRVMVAFTPITLVKADINPIMRAMPALDIAAILRLVDLVPPLCAPTAT